KLYAFGFVTGNDFTSKSDIDVLYEMDYSGFDFDKLEDCPFDPYTEYFTLKEDLEKLLNRRVDLIPNHDFRNKYFKKNCRGIKNFTVFNNTKKTSPYT